MDTQSPLSARVQSLNPDSNVLQPIKHLQKPTAGSVSNPRSGHLNCSTWTRGQLAPQFRRPSAHIQAHVDQLFQDQKTRTRPAAEVFPDPVFASLEHSLSNVEPKPERVAFDPDVVPLRRVPELGLNLDSHPRPDAWDQPTAQNQTAPNQRKRSEVNHPSVQQRHIQIITKQPFPGLPSGPGPFRTTGIPRVCAGVVIP